MRRPITAAALLTLGIAWMAYTSVANDETEGSGQSEPEARSDFADRAYQTRVGTQPAALEPDLLGEPCDGGNAARETMAMHLAEQLEEDGAENLVRGNMVERKVMLKQPCP